MTIICISSSGLKKEGGANYRGALNTENTVFWEDKIPDNKYREGTSDASLILSLWCNWRLFTLKNSQICCSKITLDRRTDGRTNGRTDRQIRPLTEMRSRI